MWGYPVLLLAIDLHFVQKDCDGNPEIAILPQFLAIEPHFVRKGCAGRLELAILLQFLTIEPHFVRKGCAGQLEIAILPQFLTIDDRNSLRAKGLSGSKLISCDDLNSQFYFSF